MSGGEDISQLHERRRIWRDKYPIRACYEKWHRMIRPWAAEGQTIEVGAGCGLMKEVWGTGLVATDILETPWVDFTMDATNMHVDAASYANLLCIDALHHFKDPHAFIDEAARVVKPGGRLLMIEAWISPASYFGYKLMHHEEVWFKDYHHPTALAEDPWAGNLALPNLVLGRDMKAWPARHPEWRALRLQKYSFFDFQLAGGFKPWAFVPNPRAYDFFLKVDDALRFAMPMLAFRIMAVFERT